MKTNRFLATALLAATMLAGCNKTDNNTPDPSSTAVKFTTVITKASGTTWASGDEIGVFMKTAGGDISTSTTLNAANVLYTTDGTAFATTTPIYYPQSGNVDFVAYYPFRATTATPYVYNVNVATQTTPADIDLLWSNATNVAKGTAAVALQFSHKLSRVQINIKAGDGLTAADLGGMSMTIDGMSTKAYFDLATAGFTNFSATAPIAPIGVTPAPTGFDKSFSAIVIPQAASGSTMSFTVGTDLYTYTIPATTFATSKSYPYTITISKTAISVSVGDITDWSSAGDPEIGTAISYQVGDYFPDPKVDLSNADEKAKILGIVFRAKTATHKGLVVSLNEANKVWSTEYNTTGATDENNGSVNMATIKAFSPTDWKTKYPAFKYCADKGAGWYLPAKDELEALRTVWNGGIMSSEMNGMRTTFNGWLTAAGGTAIMTTNWYWSSSESASNGAWSVAFASGSTGLNYKNVANVTVRAVLAF